MRTRGPLSQHARRGNHGAFFLTSDILSTEIHSPGPTNTHSHAHKLPSGLFLGWMLRRVVESRAPERPRGSFFGMDSRGRRSCRTEGQCITAFTNIGYVRNHPLFPT